MGDIVRLTDIPSTDRLLQSQDAADLIEQYGRHVVADAIRHTLNSVRSTVGSQIDSRAQGQATTNNFSEASVIELIAGKLEQENSQTLRRIFNLTGTVLHTNLGRATLPKEAVEAAAAVALGATNLEYDLATGKRGDRDDHIESQICRLTGAEAATVVNNNAAAVMLVLNSLGAGREVPTSRGELVEIGGSFRMPDIMASSGCRLREVGTTNRTHLRDFVEAIGPETGLVMKVHTSNYEVVGFTASANAADLARVCKERGVPFVIDLGSGSLIDLRRYGLPHEPTPAEAFAHGADVVTFSGDKLLGGPQAGIIAGRADLIARIKRNPMKRALRVDKMTISALSAVLRLYADPDRLAERLPTLRALTRPVSDIRRLADRVCPAVAAVLSTIATAEPVTCESQIGSGALPTKRILSAGISIKPLDTKARGAALLYIEAAFRALPSPVVGRVHDGALILDLRCLEDEAGFTAQLGQLAQRIGLRSTSGPAA
jgi:L-seryl-tRNA(Ser) seleniumtransferase